MPTTRIAFPRHFSTGLRRGSGLMRIRIWLAMLGLAVLPMVGTILLIGALQPDPDLATGERRAWQTAAAAADLSERMTAVETALLGAAADQDLAQLLDGVSGGTEQEVASRTLATLGVGEDAVLSGACLTRSSDGAAVRLGGAGGLAAAVVPVAPAANGRTAATCASAAVTRAVLAAASGSVAHSAARSEGHSASLELSTRITSSTRRESGVLTVAVDIADLFAATPSAANIASGAALVDLSTDTIVAGSRTDAIADGSADPGARPLGNLRIHIDGITSGRQGTAMALARAGWAATAAPLWRTDDGTQLGLIHVWPAVPGPDQFPLVAALLVFAIGVLLVAVALARTFQEPFDDLATSQSQLEQLYREAREDSLHDGLTGLGNHRSFQEELDRQLELQRRHKIPVALLLIDLDGLKVVNDGEGHPAGDRLLLGMANSIRDALRYGDRAFRIGGDEFAVILPHTTAPEALQAANRLRHFCLRPQAGERAIHFSGGISSVPLMAADRTELVRQADAALYRCKRSGRGTVAVFEADRDQVPDEAENHGLAQGIAAVLRTRDLQPVYQPIVDLRDGTILGFEGLIRPGRSTPFKNPSQLFAAAAVADRIVELDLACFEAVAAGSRDIDPSQVITLNLSPRTLEAHDFGARWLLEILARHQLSTGRVIVELTEREAVNDLERLRHNVAGLQRAGVRIAADDVGAGNSGLRLLSQIRFDIVKIDLSLVQEGVQHDTSREVLRSISELAARQGALVIAEGLETAEQLRVLRDLGIGAGQGYLLGRPGPTVCLPRVDVDALVAGYRILQNPQPAGAQPETAAAPAEAAPVAASPAAVTTPVAPIPASLTEPIALAAPVVTTPTPPAPPFGAPLGPFHLGGVTSGEPFRGTPEMRINPAGA